MINEHNTNFGSEGNNGVNNSLGVFFKFHLFELQDSAGIMVSCVMTGTVLRFGSFSRPWTFPSFAFSVVFLRI